MQPLSLQQLLSRRVSSLDGGSWLCPGSLRLTRVSSSAAASLCHTGAVGCTRLGTSAAGRVQGARPPPPTKANGFCYMFLHKIYTTIYLAIKTGLPPLPSPGID